LDIIKDVNEYDVLTELQSSSTNTAFVSIKSDNKLERIICFGILFDNTTYLIKILNTKYFFETLFSIIESKKIKIYVNDLKYFFKVLFNNEVSKGLAYTATYKLHDIRLYLYNLFNRYIEIYDEGVVNYANLEKVQNIESDYRKIYSDCFFFPHQVLGKQRLRLLVATELQTIEKLSSFLPSVNNEYFNLLHIASFYYAIIEQTGFKLTNLFDTYSEKIENKFIDIDYKKYKAFINYDFDHTSTGRLSSRFHNFQKSEYGDAIVPRYNDGCFLKFDWNCFELKVLFSYFGIKCIDSDIYTLIDNSIATNKNRNYVKNTIIKWMYGSEQYDSGVIDLLKKWYKIGNEVEDFRSECVRELKCDTKKGKVIKYKTQEEARNKSVNNMFQNLSTVQCLYTVCDMMNGLIVKTKSAVVATVYDEIIIDVAPGEVDIVKNIAIEAMRKNYLNDVDVNFDCAVEIGKNLKEFKHGGY